MGETRVHRFRAQYGLRQKGKDSITTDKYSVGIFGTVAQPPSP